MDRWGEEKRKEKKRRGKKRREEERREEEKNNESDKKERLKMMRREARGENSGKPHNISPYHIPHTTFRILHTTYPIPYTPYSIPHRQHPRSAYRRYVHHSAVGCVLLNTRSGLESCAKHNEAKPNVHRTDRLRRTL